MFAIPPEIAELSRWIAPPAIGGFIGYLTNKIAIKMLFRPLHPWHIGSMRVPMTPGIIPAKRHEFAGNMGEVVGNHLLTDREIGKAVQDPGFQETLQGIIRERLDDILEKDLGALGTLVPEKFQTYFSFGVVGATSKIKQSLWQYIESEAFEATCRNAVSSQLERFCLRDSGGVFSEDQLNSFEENLARNIESMLAAQELESKIESLFKQEIYSFLQNESSLDSILPGEVQDRLAVLAQGQVTTLLQGLSKIVEDPSTGEKIVLGVSEAVEGFIDSLGPMSEMIRNWMPHDKIQEQVRNQFHSRKGHITKWLQGDDIQGQLQKTVDEQLKLFFQSPLVSFVSIENEKDIDLLCQFLGKSSGKFLREQGGCAQLGQLLARSVRESVDQSERSVGELLSMLFGEGAENTVNSWVQREIVKLIRSDEGRRVLYQAIDSFIKKLLEVRIGRLERWIPPVVKNGLAESLQATFSKVLADKVPALVERLNIRKIIIERLDSLDLLYLERLLLAIMEEQFKYINIFGGLLGFLIGCVNLIFII